jgi:Nitroreductase
LSKEGYWLIFSQSLQRRFAVKECLRLITERRSITFFDPTREVPDELIKEILEISATAPSGYNLQPWEVVVVKDKEKKRQLKDKSVLKIQTY